MIALAIIGAIILIFVIILLLPVGARVVYSGDFSLYLKYGPLSIKLLPAKGKPKEETEENKKSKKKKTGKKKKKLPAFSTVMDAVDKVIKSLGKFFKKFRFRRFNVNAVISDSEPSAAAINYGRACAAATAVYTLLENSLNKNDTNISVDLEYGGKTSVNLDIIINTLTVNVLILGIRLLIIILPLINEINEKGGKKNERSK